MREFLEFAAEYARCCRQVPSGEMPPGGNTQAAPGGASVDIRGAPAAVDDDRSSPVTCKATATLASVVSKISRFLPHMTTFRCEG